MQRRTLKIVGRVAFSLLALIIVLVVVVWLAFRASLPSLDGEVKAPVMATTRIERDAQGVATIYADSLTDAIFALGYAHGQDRRFHMDLLRRSSAGELAALFGSAALELDKKARVHRFRRVAKAAFDRLTKEEQARLAAYADGVNAATDTVRVSPPEYVLLRTSPSRWLPEDAFLVVLAMYMQLQDAGAQYKIQRGAVYDALPREVADFVYSEATAYSAALDLSTVVQPMVPSARVFTLRNLEALNFDVPKNLALTTNESDRGASNNWAVSGARTGNKSGIVANDMHLGLRVPNTWYRARIVFSEDGENKTLAGVTLPGLPFMVVGSNSHVAWSFTNVTGDFQELIATVVDPSDSGRYLTKDGSEKFEQVVEKIEVKGADAVDLKITMTKWGPVIGTDAAGRPLVLEWTAHKPESLNLGLSQLRNARSVKEVLDIAQRSGMPNQNCVAADRDGHIGWTITGQIGRHRGDFSLPRLSTDAQAGIDGMIAPQEHPRIEDPENGQIATANARTVGGAALALIGDGGYARGVRQKRIQTLLQGKPLQTPQDSLAIQLDDDAWFLRAWHVRLQNVLNDKAVLGNDKRVDLANVVSRFSGRAAADDAAYTAVRLFRTRVERLVFFGIVAKARSENPNIEWRIPNSFEGPLALLVDTQPMHFLPPTYANWNDLLLKAADETIDAMEKECGSINACVWGYFNRVNIQHPLSLAMPVLGLLFDIPSNAISGDHDTPKVIAPHFGSSERLVVSVGHEDESYFHMPTGQSGHLLSPFYKAGHDAWVNGEATPFLPGKTAHTLVLTPN